MNPKQILPALLAAALLLAPAARASSPLRVPVHFAVTNDATGGYSYFVFGSHPDLGAWDTPTHSVLAAIPLAWHDGNVWSADVGVQAGAHVEYKFVRRHTGADRIADTNNFDQWLPGGDNLVLDVPVEPPAPNPGKRVILQCDWDEPVYLHYAMLSSSDPDSVVGEWQDARMTKTGAGRYELESVGEAGDWIRFVFFHPLGEEPDCEKWWYHFQPAEGIEEDSFWTPLDAFCVRDGQVFDYEPDGYVSNSRIEDRLVYSGNTNIAERTIRIYLPRGYDDHPDRRYPVVYFADGQNLFSDDQRAAMGGWKADTAADREIRAGRMREAILVGVPCRMTDIPGWPGTATYARLWEYLPGTDHLMGMEQLPGLADHYADFLLNNVRPTLDYNFRTLTGRDNTAHIGSSAGGLLSFYFGIRYTNDFGLVGALSGVYNTNYIPNLTTWCKANLASVAAPKRLWLDTGTEETAVGDGDTVLNLYASNWDALTLLLYAGHVHNKSLHFAVYHSQTGEHGYDNAGEHNEIAWAARIGDVLSFLLPATDEYNPLLQTSLSMDGADLTLPLWGHTAYDLLRAAAITNPAAAESVWSLDAFDRPWSNATFKVTQPGFYWLRGK